MPENGVAGAVLAQIPVKALHETLRIDCTRGETCEFEATYDVENPGAGALEVVGAFFGFGGSSVDVALDRVDVGVDLPPEQVAMLVDRARAVTPPGSVSQEDWQHAKPERGFRFRLEGRRRAQLVFRGGLRPVERSRDDLDQGYAYSPATTRHPFVFSSKRGMTHTYAYAIAPIRTWGGAPIVDVEILLPDDHHIEPSAEWDSLAQTEHRGNVRRVTAAIDPTRVAGLGFSLRDPRHDSIFAGPVVGIGGRLNAKELRLRAGLEFTGPAAWAIYSLNMDSNLKNYFIASGVFEVASRSYIGIFPSFGVGAGVPVRVEKGEATRVGIRTQLAINWPVLGVVLPLDYYPAAGPAGDHFDLSLMGRLSF